jgi:hypothetical protein
MTLLSPLALLWLGITVLVVLLYFLKMRRRKVQVSSTWLWHKSINDLRVNAPFQRLRKSLLLVLQLLLIAAGAVALSHPIARSSPPEHKRWVFMIDRSVSMQMKDVAPSRLAKAKEAARQVLRECGPSDEVMVVAFSGRAQVMTPMTASRTAVESAIDRIEPSEAATRAQEAYHIAAAALEGARTREIVVFSDGGFEAIQGSEDVPLRFIPIGGKPKNAGITAMDVKRPQRADEPWSVFVQVDLHHSEKEQEVPLELYVNGELKAVRKVTITAGEGVGTIFDVSRPEPEVVQAKIAWEDDLEADNRAWHIVHQEKTKILYVGQGNFFLENALAQVKDSEAFKAAELGEKSSGDYAVVVLDGVVPGALPEGRYLVFGGVPAWEGIQVGAPMELPAVVDWNRRHPVTRLLELSEMAIKEAPRVTLPGFATPIMETSDAPLLFAWEKGRTRAVVVPFKLAESDWPFKPSFPLFIWNALEWLRSEMRTRPRPGEPLRIRLEGAETSIEVTTPANRKETLEGEKDADVVFGDTDRVGLYVVTRGKESRPVALNLFEPQETRGAVATELKLGQGKVARAGGVTAPMTPLWRWLAAGVLVLLALEWLVYHRRIEI